ncbi:hypothetical protein BC829DRAFT_442039 [Chytridium lagenaria]|nr:hypothetical protein BC829DRAFT_442039 [Chytridium lagenaria]
MEFLPDDENATIPLDPTVITVQERNYNLMLWMPFVVIPTFILTARAIKYLYRIYQAKKYGYGDDLIDDPLSQLGLAQLGLKLNRGYDDLSDIRNIRKEQKRLERKIAKEDPTPGAQVWLSAFVLKPLFLAENYLQSLRRRTKRTWTDYFSPDAVRRFFDTSRYGRMWMIFQVACTVVAIVNYVLLTYTIQRTDRKMIKGLDFALAPFSSSITPSPCTPRRPSRLLLQPRILIDLLASVINALETINVEKKVTPTLTTWHDSLYYIMYFYGVNILNAVLLDSVISPQHHPSRVVVMFLIVIVIVYVPLQTTRIVDIFSSTSSYQRARHRGSESRPHVILTGTSIPFAVLIDFLKEFMAASAASSPASVAGSTASALDAFSVTERKTGAGVAEDAVHVVVVLTKGQPCLETRKLLRHPFYRNKIKFLEGSAMSIPDLRRADAQRATGLFILGGMGGGNDEDDELKTSRTADASVLMQALVAKKAHPGLMVMSQVTDVRSEELSFKCGCDRTLCLEKVVMGVFAKDCLVMGYMTLVTNLVATYRDAGVEDRWEALRKKQRMEKKLKKERRKKAKSPLGLTFGRSGMDVGEMEEEEDEEDDEDVEPREVRRVREYSMGSINQVYTVRTPTGLARLPFREAVELVYASFAVTIIGIIPSSGPRSGVLILNPGSTYLLRDDDVLLCIVPSSSGDEVTLRISIQFREGVTKDQLKMLENEHAKAMPENFVPSVTASQDVGFAVDEGKENPFKESSSRISLDALSDHVILCGQFSARALRHFITCIRRNEVSLVPTLSSTTAAPSVTTSVPIVCLMDNVPDEATEDGEGIWSEIMADKNVAIVRGTPLKKTSLEKAGIRRCRRIVIFAEGKRGGEVGGDSETDGSHALPDANSIFIIKMIQEEFPGTPFLVELVSASNVRYFSSDSHRFDTDTSHIRMRSIVDNASLSVADRVSLYRRVRMRGVMEDSFLWRLWRFAIGSDLKKDDPKKSGKVVKRRRKAKSGMKRLEEESDGAPLLDEKTVTWGEVTAFAGAKSPRSEAKIAKPAAVDEIQKSTKVDNKKGSVEEDTEDLDEDDSPTKSAAEVLDSAPTGRASSSVSSAYLDRMVAEAEANDLGISGSSTSTVTASFDRYTAAGWVATQSFPYTLLAQCYFRPFILDVVKGLSDSVSQISVPEKYRGRMYSELVVYLLAKDLLAVGLYRGGAREMWRWKEDVEENGRRNESGELPYVYTNCRGYDIVGADDLIFVIRPSTELQ